jgi:cytochrome c oxidase cbb3-type subunit 3
MSDNKEWDGIRQDDNKLPGWYIWSFIGTIIFGVVYMIMYHVTDNWTQIRAFQEEVADHAKTYGNAVASIEQLSDKKNPFRGDLNSIKEGEKSYKAICAACHGQNAEGIVGPKLSDATWLYGSTEKTIFNVIMEGRIENLKQNPPKGPMPGHKQSLGAKKVWQIVAYLTSKYKNIQE